MRRPKGGDKLVSYSEIMRVVGQYVERAHLSEIRVLETDEGLILQGLVTQGEHAGERDTYQLTTDDIGALIDDAHALRGKKV
jgi:hypothetical protein